MKAAENFIIKNMTYKYGFNQIENGKVSIFVDVEYQAENISDAAQEYAPVLQVEENDKCVILQASYFHGKERVIIDGKGAIVESNRRGVVKAVGHKQLIEPGEQGHTFLWHYAMTKNASDNDMMAFGAKTHGLRVVSIHDPNQLSVIIDDEYGLTKLDDFTWESAQEFIAGQHIRIRWFEM